MVIQSFIYELGNGFYESQKFNSLVDFNVYFEKFIESNNWKGFFARYSKCLEHIYSKDDYSEKNLLRLHLLFTGKHDFTEEYEDVSDYNVNVKIDDNHIIIQEQDEEIKMTTLYSYLFIIENHPMQIMYKKYKEYCNEVGYDAIESKLSSIINFEEDDTEYFVNEFSINI